MKRFSEGDSVKIGPGEAFEIVLPEPGASGYLFTLSGFDPGILCMLEESHSPGVIGGGQGFATFRFRAVSVGEVALTFDLRAPWDEVPARQNLVEVVVE